MKNLMQWIIGLAVLPQAALLAQNLVGTWQGTLQAPNRDLRTVIKISTTDKDTLKAILYSIDQGAQGIPSSSVTVQGSAVKILVPGIGGTYEGKLSADGNSIAGTWTQGPRPLTLNLTRVTEETAWAIPNPPAPPKPMAAANPVFEVATVKPSRPDERGFGFGVRGRHFSTTNTSVADLITFAHKVQYHQITGGPAWLNSDKFDLSAEPDGDGQPNDGQWRTMVQKLLTDRFKLSFHRDKKELSVYALSVLKTGPKLTPSGGDPNGLPGLGFGGLGRFFARNATMADFSGVMQTTALDRPVVDQTGIQGRYDFSLTWTPDEFQFPGLKAAGAPPLPPPRKAKRLRTSLPQFSNSSA